MIKLRNLPNYDAKTFFERFQSRWLKIKGITATIPIAIILSVIRLVSDQTKTFFYSHISFCSGSNRFFGEFTALQSKERFLRTITFIVDTAKASDSIFSWTFRFYSICYVDPSTRFNIFDTISFATPCTM